MNTLSYNAQSLQRLCVQEVLSPVAPASISAQDIDDAARKFIASLSPEALKGFNGRLERGLEIAKKGSVTPISDPRHPRCFTVVSSDGTQSYHVDLNAKTCDCPDSQKGHTCKHRIAAYYIEQAGMLKAQTTQDTTPRSSSPFHPTCTVPPQQQPVVKPTCSIPPTRKEFETAEKRASSSATREQPTAAPVKRSEEQILKELGFDAGPKKILESSPDTGPQLGSLYRRFLHGSDLAGQVFSVTIVDITQEKVMPHPSMPPVEKWCLWVKGLPEEMPKGILFGATGEHDLVAIFGKVSVMALKGKPIAIYPKPMSVAGQTKVAIRFRSSQ